MALNKLIFKVIWKRIRSRLTLSPHHRYFKSPHLVSHVLLDVILIPMSWLSNQTRCSLQPQSYLSCIAPGHGISRSQDLWKGAAGGRQPFIKWSQEKLEVKSLPACLTGYSNSR